MKPTTILVATALIFAACKSTTTKEITEIENATETISSVVQPINDLQNPASIFTIVSDIESKIELPNGGSIEVPAGAFVDQDGKSVSGKVDVEWAEFHSLTDIMLSGIPMKYDSAGIEYNFVSGGMFTINAKQSGENIFVKEGERLKVNLASMDDTPCYNFYQLDEKTGDWSYDKTDVATPIASSESVKGELETPKKEDPVIIDAEVDFSEFSELSNMDIVAWKATEKLTLDEKRRIKNYVSMLSLQKDDKGYFLDFKRMKNAAKIYVAPFTLRDAQKQQTTLKEEIKDDLAAIKTLYQNEGKGRLMRTTSITSFGTFNWDHYSSNELQPLFAEFKYGSAKNPELASLFYMNIDDNLLIKCNALEDRSFVFQPKKRCALIAIMPNNEIYTMNNSGFKEIASQRNRANYTFNLKASGITAQNGDSVADIAKGLF